MELSAIRVSFYLLGFNTKGSFDLKATEAAQTASSHSIVVVTQGVDCCAFTVLLEIKSFRTPHTEIILKLSAIRVAQCKIFIYFAFSIQQLEARIA